MKPISALDLSSVIQNMVAREGWSLKDALAVAGLYRNYLYLLAKYPDKSLPPSEDVDEFWHMHILDTQKYRADCDAMFGRYIDHNPQTSTSGLAGISDLNAAFQETQALHCEEFGEYIYQIRGPFKKLASMCRKLKKELKK